MAMTYDEARKLFESRRNDGRNFKRYSHNQVIEYNEREDCYMHRHHQTVTVKIFRDKYRLNTGGWDTNTTWAKINDIARPPYTWRGRDGIPSTALEHKFLGREGRVSPYFDGIEFWGDHVLNPVPYHVRHIKKGAAHEFTQMRRAVMERIGPRVMIGEFDPKYDDFAYRKPSSDEPPTGKELWVAMQQIAILPTGAWVDPAMVAPLLVQRPRVVFGRERECEGQPNALQLVESSFRAALVYFHTINDSYEEVEVKGYD